jgi:hypothetical protein
MEEWTRKIDGVEAPVPFAFGGSRLWIGKTGVCLSALPVAVDIVGLVSF